jgi:hypothetical protein
VNGPYKPPQSTLAALVRTVAGRLHATFHIPKGHSFADHLARFAFWNLTDVTLPGAKERLSFFALRSAAALIVVPEGDEAALQLAPLHGSTKKHRIACLLQLGTVTGDIELLPNVRVSDYVLHHTGFFCLRDAELAGEGSKLPFAMVNAAALVGVSELGYDPNAQQSG